MITAGDARKLSGQHRETALALERVDASIRRAAERGEYETVMQIPQDCHDTRDSVMETVEAMGFVVRYSPANPFCLSIRWGH